MALTHCYKRTKDGVVDLPYIESRLDSIEARIDDLCGLLGSVLEAVGLDAIDTKAGTVCVGCTYNFKLCKDHNGS